MEEKTSNRRRIDPRIINRCLQEYMDSGRIQVVVSYLFTPSVAGPYIIQS